MVVFFLSDFPSYFYVPELLANPEKEVEVRTDC